MVGNKQKSEGNHEKMERKLQPKNENKVQESSKTKRTCRSTAQVAGQVVVRRPIGAKRKGGRPRKRSLSSSIRVE